MRVCQFRHSRKVWAGVDSNHRSQRRQIYSLLPLATREPVHITPPQKASYNGAGDGTRTRNLLITNQLLCQLSYTSEEPSSSVEAFSTLNDYIILLNLCQPLFVNFFDFLILTIPLRDCIIRYTECLGEGMKTWRKKTSEARNS